MTDFTGISDPDHEAWSLVTPEVRGMFLGALGMHFDFEGNSISMAEWGEIRFTRMAECQVGLDRFGDTEVSTVWIGMDMRLIREPNGTPLIYETAILAKGAGVFGRYATREAALQGHQAACEEAERRWRFEERS